MIELLKQKNGAPIPMEKQVAMLYAAIIETLQRSTGRSQKCAKAAALFVAFPSTLSTRRYSLRNKEDRPAFGRFQENRSTKAHGRIPPRASGAVRCLSKIVYVRKNRSSRSAQQLTAGYGDGAAEIRASQIDSELVIPRRKELLKAKEDAAQLNSRPA